jgi:hypothetical protein
MKKAKTNLLKSGIDFLVKHEWLVILLFLVFVLRIPSLFEPHWYGDEEIYLVMGQGLRKGLVFYRDIFDHKPPLIYVLAAIVRNVFWFRLLLMIVHGVSVVFFAKLSELIFKKKSSAILATFVYALFSTIPLLEGNIANGENFMTVPALIGMYLTYKLTQKHTEEVGKWLWVGLWFSIAFLVKVPIIFDFFAAGAFWLLISEDKLRLSTFKKLISPKLWLVLLGFFVPIVLSIVYYWSAGAIEPYLRSVLLQNIGYVESWRGEAAGSPFANPLVWRAALITLFLAVGIKMRACKGVSKKMLFVSTWWLLSVYGSLLSNRPYPHYLLQPLIPGILLLFLLIDNFLNKSCKKDLFLGVVGILLGGVMIGEIGFWGYPTISYYKNFINYTTHRIDKDQYRAYFPSALERNTKIALYIRERTEPDERIFVWGEEPTIYDLADRLPVGKYIVSFHIRDFPNGYAETMTKILEKKPRYIIVLPKQVPPFPQLESLIQTEYVQVEQIDDAQIYKLLDPLAIYHF